MNPDEIRTRFTPAIEEIIDRCRVSEEFVDKEKFQVMIATVWGNAVIDPARSGIDEDDLADLHDFLNEKLEFVVGEGESITRAYEFIVSKKGQDSLSRQQLSANHKEFLQYFARLILADGMSLPTT